MGQLTQTKKMNDECYTYHQLKMAINTIIKTRKKPTHSVKTSLDIIHDLNVLRHKAKELKLQCANSNLFDRIQSKLLGTNFKQPALKTHTKIIKKNQSENNLKPLIQRKRESVENGKEEMDENEMKENEQNKEAAVDEETQKIEFQFDSSDLQRYLDANSEIIGRLQSIRKQKSFYGVTQEEIDLNKQFAKNVATMMKY